MSLTMKTWFRTLLAAGTPKIAQIISGMSVIIFVLYIGYAIPQPSTIKALIWIACISPLRSGFEAVITNEFRHLNGACSSLVPQGPGYENVGIANAQRAGQAYVNGRRFLELSYGYSYAITWRNYGIIVAFGVAFLFAYMYFTRFSTNFAGHRSL